MVLKNAEHPSAQEAGISNRAIARTINFSPSTVGYELRCGTPEYCGRDRKVGYSAKRGAAVYKFLLRFLTKNIPAKGLSPIGTQCVPMGLNVVYGKEPVAE